MPGNRSNSQSNLKTIVINDFTPGINNQAFSTLANTNSFTRTPSKNSVTSSPYTYGVMGLPEGGLLLGPTVFSVTNNFLPIPAGSSSTIVTGVFNSGPFFYPITNELISGNVNVTAYNGTTLLETKTLSTGTTDWPSFPFITTIYNSSTPIGVLVFNSPLQTSAHCYWYNGSGTGDFSGSGGRNGWGIPANGRVWLLEMILAAENVLPDVYNCVSFTDPSIPASGSNTTFGSQETFIDYDDPSSFGAWGTVTSGETMLIKTSSGGVLVTGDIYNPNVTLAPSVMGTNGMLGQACLSPLGLVYRSYANGVWVWSGGANATKLSPQLDDSVWPENNLSAYQTTAPKENWIGSGLSYPFFNVQFINNLLLFDGGFIYNLATNSWWRLPPYATTATPSAIFAPCFYIPKFQSPIQFSALYANGPAAANTAQTTDYAMDVSAGNYTFVPPTGYFGSFWESNVIQPTRSIIEVQEIYLLMQGKGTLSVSCLGIGGATLSSKQVTVNSNTGYEQIKVSGKFETDGLILQIGWTNATGSSNNTPIIDSIEIDYEERFPVPVAN